MNLSRYDGKRIAIVIQTEDRRVALQGVAKFEQENGQAQLRVDVQGEESRVWGSPSFLFSEGQWQGAVEADCQFGCDFLIRLDVSSS